jgi:catechol 2,3-dioxygenase-like lactoylglutathione lyase family enzyme
LAGLHHLGISVTNLERSIRFYSDVLGADVVLGETTDSERRFPGRMAILSLGGRIFDLCEHPANEGERLTQCIPALTISHLRPSHSRNFKRGQVGLIAKVLRGRRFGRWPVISAQRLISLILMEFRSSSRI